MPTDHSLNVLDRFQREHQQATNDTDPALYRRGAVAVERLRQAATEDPATYWLALAERLHRKGHRVGWMLAVHDGATALADARQCYGAAFEPIDNLQVITMAKKQHFENGEVRDGTIPEDHSGDCECEACVRARERDGGQDA